MATTPIQLLLQVDEKLDVSENVKTAESLLDVIATPLLKRALTPSSLLPPHPRLSLCIASYCYPYTTNPCLVAPGKSLSIFSPFCYFLVHHRLVCQR